MAKEAYDKVPVRLSDGTEVTLKPSNIGRLRKIMKAWGEIETKEGGEPDPDKGFDVFINTAGIALESELKGREELKDKFEETQGSGDQWLSDEYREYLEDTLDMETIYKVLEVCAGLKLNDPNLLRAAQAAAAGGTN